MDRETLALACALADPSGRSAAAARLARHLGAEALVVLVRDPGIDAFLPAPGFPQTLPGGPGWTALLSRCRTPGEHAGRVGWPDRGTPCDALALAIGSGLALVLLGGRPHTGDQQVLCLPLLAAALRAEVVAEGARGRERHAREEMRHAATLTSVLDATRAELERTLDDTRRLNLELKGVDRAKDEFLAMLAHELRNPLAPIVSALAILRLQGPASPSFDRLLGVMDRQARHLSRLVDDLLDVSRISRGQIDLRSEPLELKATLLQAIDTARPLIESEQHTLSVLLPERPAHVVGDSVRLAQVFANLLTNAAKYTPSGGRIEVEIRHHGAQVALHVRDNGIGIEAEMLPRVFDLFTQAPRALDRAKGGLGIGLTLVRRLVEMHGGTVEAASGGVGTGSEFVVRLPAAEPPEAEPRSAKPSLPGTPGAPFNRVLVVEDNPDAGEVLSEMLRLSGYDVRLERDGEAGIRAAREFGPEVALIDIGLPGMTGYEVARRLRETLPSARLVALSGYGGGDYRDRGREAGFDTYLTKPVEVAALLEVLRGSRPGRDSPRPQT